MYPGLPNWGYGAQIPVETLLQLLPFKTLPKQLAQRQLDRLVAETGAQNSNATESGARTRLINEQATEFPLSASAGRGLTQAQTREASGRADVLDATSPYAGRRALGEAEQVESETDRLRAGTFGQWLSNAFFPSQARAQVQNLNAQTADIPQNAQDRRAGAAADTTRAQAFTDSVKTDATRTKTSDLLNAVQAFSGVSRRVPRTDAQGRQMTDKKRQPVFSDVPFLDEGSLDSVWQYIQQLFSLPAGAPTPTGPSGNDAAAAQAIQGALAKVLWQDGGAAPAGAPQAVAAPVQQQTPMAPGADLGGDVAGLQQVLEALQAQGLGGQTQQQPVQPQQGDGFNPFVTAGRGLTAAGKTVSSIPTAFLKQVLSLFNK